MISRLDHVAIAVHDLERSVAFYSTHFGLEPYARHEMRPGSPLKTIAYLRSPQGVLELMHAPDRGIGEGFHFCFVTDDFDTTFARLERDGVPVRTRPHHTPPREPGEEQWLRCTFTGPDGEEVELRGPSRLAA